VAIRLDTPNEALVRLAGHPAPILLGRPPRPICPPIGLPLGIAADTVWEPVRVPLDPDWALLLYTDGLIEGHTGVGTDRLEVDGLCGLLDEPAARQVPLAALPAWLVGRAEQANGGPLADDVAMLLISRGGGR
jgi:serine phosphatase RsbU (regulator of sigma subunit)